MKSAASLLLVFISLLQLGWAAEGKDANESKGTKVAPEIPPIPAPGLTPSGVNWMKSRGGVARSVRSFCQSKNIAFTEHGVGAVRVILAGAVTVKDPIKEIVEPGQMALEGLELWTGSQGQFPKAAATADETYHLCIFANDADMAAFIDAINPGQDNSMSKATLNTTYPRGLVGAASKSLPILRWWSVYGTSCLALDAFFCERGATRAPPWLREGLGADLQRRVCENQVRIYTISYELSTSKMDGDWAKDIAAMIAQKSKDMRPAGDVMLMDTIKLPGEYYKQMWSLASYVNNSAKAQKGPNNKLMQLFVEIINGQSSMRAVKNVYGKEDPALTKAWRAWAAQAK
jgi:hypothetical protein